MRLEGREGERERERGVRRNGRDSPTDAVQQWLEYSVSEELLQSLVLRQTSCLESRSHDGHMISLTDLDNTVVDIQERSHLTQEASVRGGVEKMK